ncbi:MULTISPECIES: ribosomal protein S18-alanine N-acetyltransferase [Bacillaceae]|uniref:[Ribosomal protein bS18]-alanine N-acetyltransferase n=1 Tax=Peribacillus huizhouensis TaxID=1501239 RepID=A0ABR6CVX0_9BACI|nr:MULTISPECIES: ribosomal protein S18-alanine N-acetyltransferase [Bacillaceae]MBA9029178.1 ribosomal-protein-alanine N-acetyltransferase [Peribacillus huizhouensis]
MSKTMTFRLMRTEDIDQVLIVERQSFTLPWSREAFYNELNHNQYAKYLVIEDEGKIAGYCGAWIVIDEAHITNIAILPDYRGLKLGEELLRKMIDVALSMGVIRMTLEVRVSNIVAQSLYKKLGFQTGGIRKNYYTDNQEDAYVMWVNLT